MPEEGMVLGLVKRRSLAVYLTVAVGGTWPSIIISHQPHCCASSRSPACCRAKHSTAATPARSSYCAREHLVVTWHQQPSLPKHGSSPQLFNSSACRRTIAHMRRLISIWYAAQLARVAYCPTSKGGKQNEAGI